jgi:hypothetical protein
MSLLPHSFILWCCLVLKGSCMLRSSSIRFFILTHLLTLTIALVLTACGSGSNSNGNNPTNSPQSSSGDPQPPRPSSQNLRLTASEAIELERRAAESLVNTSGIALLSWIDANCYNIETFQGVFLEDRFESSGLNPTLGEVSTSLQTYLRETDQLLTRMNPESAPSFSASLRATRKIAQDFVGFLRRHETQSNTPFREFLRECRERPEREARERERSLEEYRRNLAETNRRLLIREERTAYLRRAGQPLPSEDYWNGLSSEDWTRLQEDTRRAGREHTQRNQALEIRRNALIPNIEAIQIPTIFDFVRPDFGSERTPQMILEDEQNNVRRQNGLALSQRRQDLIGQIRTADINIILERDLDRTEAQIHNFEEQAAQLQRDAQANLQRLREDIARLEPRYIAARERLDSLRSNPRLESHPSLTFVRSIHNLAEQTRNIGSEANLIWLEGQIQHFDELLQAL